MNTLFISHSVLISQLEEVTEADEVGAREDDDARGADDPAQEESWVGFEEEADGDGTMSFG